MRKNDFYFMLHVKSIFVLEIFTFLFRIFGYVKNSLIKKLWLISRFMTLKTRKKIITIHVLPSISRSKGKQAIKFGHLI